MIEVFSATDPAGKRSIVVVEQGINGEFRSAIWLRMDDARALAEGLALLVEEPEDV